MENQNQVQNDNHKTNEIPIHIDNTMYRVPYLNMTGIQLRALANITIEYDLWQVQNGKQDDLLIEDTVEVELKPGMHFITSKKIVTPGADSAPGFLLPADIEYLKGKGYNYEVVNDSNYHYFTIKDYQLPSHYNISKTDLLIIVPVAGYPMTALDMFYLNPFVKYSDGRIPQATTKVNYINKEWQQFSRHYTWRPGVDSIISHLKMVQNELHKAI